MKAQAPYTLHHPKWYRHPVSVWWWLENWPYAKFVLRELTSVFVALFAVVTLWQLRALISGPAEYANFLARLSSPSFIIFHSVAFLFVLFHAITWFNLAPRAIILRLRGKRVPDFVIIGLNYFAWLAASGAVAWLLLRG